MGRKRTPGLYKRRDCWHIDKQIFGRRLCESTGANCLEEAEKYLARRIEELRQALVYGVRPKRTFRQAATKYLLENQEKSSIGHDNRAIRYLDQYVGSLFLESVHMGSLQSFVEARKKAGVKNRTINSALQTARHILNLAASEWLDEQGLTWLGAAPKIKLLPEIDKRKPYPLSWDEQTRLFQELPSHLEKMALFAVNTGCRDTEICQLRWKWEVSTGFPECTAFIIPGEYVKNREERLVVLNTVAQGVVESVRHEHSEYVFSYRGKPVCRMHNTAWKNARKRAQLAHVRVHDLKHTFGRRLRAANVCFEDRQDLLGHKSGRMTTHYSMAEVGTLIKAANSVCDRDASSVTLTLLKDQYVHNTLQLPQNSRKAIFGKREIEKKIGKLLI